MGQAEGEAAGETVGEATGESLCENKESIGEQMLSIQLLQGILVRE